MPKCPICDAEVNKFGDQCGECNAAISDALDDFDMETIDGIQIAGIVMPLEKAPRTEDE